MSNILNYGVPALIIVVFVVYFVYQIFFRETKPTKQKKDTILYNAHSSNTSTPADQEFNVLENNKFSFNYLESSLGGHSE